MRLNDSLTDPSNADDANETDDDDDDADVTRLLQLYPSPTDSTHPEMHADFTKKKQKEFSFFFH